MQHYLLTSAQKFGPVACYIPFYESKTKIGRNQDSVAGSVIQVSRMVVFEDVLMTDTTAADTWLACSVRTNPEVHLAAHGSSHLTQGGSPNLGKPSAEGYLSDRDGPNVQRQLRAISEGNVGYCGVRFNWPRKLGTIV